MGRTKKVETTQKIDIHFLGIGSARQVEKSDTSGRFFFKDEEGMYIFWNKNGKKIDERRFESYSEMIAYFKKEFSNYSLFI